MGERRAMGARMAAIFRGRKGSKENWRAPLGEGRRAMGARMAAIFRERKGSIEGWRTPLGGREEGLWGQEWLPSFGGERGAKRVGGPLWVGKGEEAIDDQSPRTP